MPNNEPEPLHCNPVVIIGAGRSGTNMLRNILTKFDCVSTWPCDEINYIWRHGNRDSVSDEFDEKHAREKVVKYIRGRFRQFASNSSHWTCTRGEKYLVEKTCANSLRVNYVNRVLPEARYIYLVRDGRDVVASAIQRWKAPLDIPYLFAKARYVPWSDLLFYGKGYFENRMEKFSNPESRLSIWGPKFKGWPEIVNKMT